MPQPDLVLLHAPSVYDFRRNVTFYGPISEVIPSTPVFEMYPIGFISLAGYLERNGYHVRILNLAVKMLRNPQLDVEALLRRLEPAAFGLDLHWLVHAQGSLEVAKLIKKHHPNTPTILGGLSATYFHEEIMAHSPQADYVLMGDSAEEPLLQLMDCLEKGRSPTDVPNLAWRDRDGRTHVNPFTYVPDTLDDLTVDYGEIIRLVIRYHDITGNLPFESWLDYPWTALLTCKGCLHNCLTCGGSRSAYERFYHRAAPAFKSPERLVDEMKVIEEYVKGPIFLLGDPRQGGAAYVSRLFHEMRRQSVDNPVTVELFTPALRDFIADLAGSCPSFNLEISPDSHDEELRRVQGRDYTNAALEKMLENALALGCEKVDVFFMIGLAKQTRRLVGETVEYCRLLLERFSGRGAVHPFIAPLAPFLDPGSDAFEEPAQHGFIRFFTTLGEHAQALQQASWARLLNYETRWMTREDLVDVTYQSLSSLTELKREHGLLDEGNARKVLEGIALSRRVAESIERILTAPGDEAWKHQLQQVRGDAEAAMWMSSFSKETLRAPTRASVRLVNAAKQLLRNALSRRVGRR